MPKPLPHEITRTGRYVPDALIKRWARRYVEIMRKHGEPVAYRWVTSFINPEDRERVITALIK